MITAQVTAKNTGQENRSLITGAAYATIHGHSEKVRPLVPSRDWTSVMLSGPVVFPSDLRGV
jgi:hypothetical protein